MFGLKYNRCTTNMLHMWRTVFYFIYNVTHQVPVPVITQHCKNSYQNNHQTNNYSSKNSSNIHRASLRFVCKMQLAIISCSVIATKAQILTSPMQRDVKQPNSNFFDTIMQCKHNLPGMTHSGGFQVNSPVSVHCATESPLSSYPMSQT